MSLEEVEAVDIFRAGLAFVCTILVFGFVGNGTRCHPAAGFEAWTVLGVGGTGTGKLFLTVDILPACSLAKKVPDATLTGWGDTITVCDLLIVRGGGVRGRGFNGLVTAFASSVSTALSLDGRKV